MKYLILLLMPVLLIACGGETDNTVEVDDHNPMSDTTYCDCKELIFDESYNNFYLVKAREGFTGFCEEFYSNGQVSLSKNFTNGKVDGEVKMYFEDGSIKEEKTFDMNFQTGDHFKYNIAGQITFHAKYNRGKQTEILISWPTN